MCVNMCCTSGDDLLDANLFVYVCMYVCVYVCVYIYAAPPRLGLLDANLFAHVCMYVSMYVCMYACIHVNTYDFHIHIGISRIHTEAYVPKCVVQTSQVAYPQRSSFYIFQVYIYIHIYIHICIYIYTHTQSGTRTKLCCADLSSSIPTTQ